MDETHCRALSLQCSSSFSLSLQVCDFMYNYLHNYSSLHPTVSGGLFLSLWYLLSFFFFFLEHTPVLAPSRPCLLFAPVLRLVSSLSLVWGRPVVISERQQSRYSVHEEAGGLLLGRHASSLIIHSHITNLKSLKVCQKGMRGKQNAAVFFFSGLLKAFWNCARRGEAQTLTVAL